MWCCGYKLPIHTYVTYAHYNLFTPLSKFSAAGRVLDNSLFRVSQGNIFCKRKDIRCGALAADILGKQGKYPPIPTCSIGCRRCLSVGSAARLLVTDFQFGKVVTDAVLLVWYMGIHDLVPTNVRLCSIGPADWMHVHIVDPWTRS